MIALKHCLFWGQLIQFEDFGGASSYEYRKIPKISPGTYIFQRPFLGGLYLEGLIYGGKFAFQNRLGWPYSWKEIDRFCFVLVCI